MNTKNQRLAKGYMNKVLHVDLSRASYRTEPLDPKTTELFFGGRGFGIYYLFDHYLKCRRRVCCGRVSQGPEFHRNQIGHSRAAFQEGPGPDDRGRRQKPLLFCIGVERPG